MKNTRIIFMGTADFSETVLQKLIDNNYNVVSVVTQPDRLVGRKKILTPSLVKKLALKYSIPVIQPESIKNEYQDILDMEPDLIITAAYGQIVPQVVLDAPSIKAINVHASLLPKYRGGAPVHYAILNGEKTTGVTIMEMVRKMDAGPIIAQISTMIDSEENVGCLYKRLSDLGAQLLIETLPSIINQTATYTKQDESLVTYSPVISRQDERIDFSKNIEQVHNQIRGLNPWPGAYTTYNGKVVKIWSGKIHDCLNARIHHSHQEPGTIVKIFKDAIGVKAGEVVYLITELQIEGKKKMTVSEYLRGNNIFEVGKKFE